MRLTTTSLCILVACTSLLAQEEVKLIARARGIHARVLTLDTHKDIAVALATDPKTDDPKEQQRYRERFDPTVRGNNQVDFPKMREGLYDCAFYIVYTGQAKLDPGSYIRAKKTAMLKFDAIHRMAEKYGDHIGLATSPAEVRAIHKSGRLVACIGIENGYPMGTDLGLIEVFHKRGARYMGITHTRHSQLGDSFSPPEPLHGGLSELGKQAVLEMNRVGIMVDVSHSGKQTMLQAAALSKAPILASHSGCGALYNHGRNLDDEQLLALKRNGGVIQIVAFGAYLKDYTARNEAVAGLRKKVGAPGRREIWKMREAGELPDKVKASLKRLDEAMASIDTKHPKTSVVDLVDHIDHAVKLIGILHVAISSDFDGGGGIVGWKDASETFNVTLELVRRGYNEQEISQLWSGNTLRLWGEVEAIAAGLKSDQR